jgi:hypothetical protein
MPLQLEVTICDLKNTIYKMAANNKYCRNIDNTLDLHVAVNDAMGWLDYHLHHFEIKGKGKRNEVHIGIPDFYQVNDDMPEVYPGWEIWMGAYFNTLGLEAKYLYDYGDGWEHSVKLEGYIYREKALQYPVCIAGERACPVEDCGGIGGSHLSRRYPSASGAATKSQHGVIVIS